jgi:hypothetical protein
VSTCIQVRHSHEDLPSHAVQHDALDLSDPQSHYNKDDEPTLFLGLRILNARSVTAYVASQFLGPTDRARWKLTDMIDMIKIWEPTAAGLSALLLVFEPKMSCASCPAPMFL